MKPFNGRGSWVLVAVPARTCSKADAEPPDHLLVVENEAGLREILQAEIRGYLGWPIQSCSLDIFAGEPACSVGAQVVAANHLVDKTNPRVRWNWWVIGLVYARVAEHIEGVLSSALRVDP